ncbi:hypothetical protein N8I74_13015 [Chitiniphilus purpureus]|uniref:Stress-induced protein n=1 Tax=Chitiniphilus purpureus TaxID=2981137 RepID=A0ABY6DIT1_9NEIS|nr:hypothetical protein [Chitiniphilus sp. CD1]UXY14232.1 hypothetical protein N8I74_13015 [Chitiniphilus sp. CD1]
MSQDRSLPDERRGNTRADRPQNLPPEDPASMLARRKRATGEVALSPEGDSERGATEGGRDGRYPTQGQRNELAAQQAVEAGRKKVE